MLDQLLLARDEATFDAAREAGYASFHGHFPDTEWTCEVDRKEYTDTNYNTIWKTEMRRPVVHALEDAGKSRDDYAAWLGDTHWVSAIAYSKHLFADGYKQNQGWRIVALGIPPAGVVAFGLASSYHISQNHNALGLASNLFYRHIETILGTAQGMVGRPVTAADWDRRGLIPTPILNVAGVSMADVNPDEPGLWLQDMRITTLKRTLASFITIHPLTPSPAFATEAGSALDRLRDLGSVLLGPA